MKKIVTLILFVFSLSVLNAQTEENLRLIDWQPKSQMVVKETVVMKPKFPVIDFHDHLRNLSRAKTYLEEMDKAGVWMCVNLDGPIDFCNHERV